MLGICLYWKGIRLSMPIFYTYCPRYITVHMFYVSLGYGRNIICFRGMLDDVIEDWADNIFIVFIGIVWLVAFACLMVLCTKWLYATSNIVFLENKVCSVNKFVFVAKYLSVLSAITWWNNFLLTYASVIILKVLRFQNNLFA